MGVVLDGEFLIVSNRGARAFERDGLVKSDIENAEQTKNNIIIYKIPDISKIDLAYIEKIRATGTREDSTEVMSHILSVLKKDNLKPIPFCVLDNKAQKHGNCSFANIKSAIHGELFLLKYKRLKKEAGIGKIPAMTEEQTINEAKKEEEIINMAKKYAKKQYKSFTKAIRDKAVTELLKVLNPSANLTATPKLRDKDLAFELLLLNVQAHHGQKKETKYDRTEKQNAELNRVEYILSNLLPKDRHKFLMRLRGREVNLLKVALEAKHEGLVQLIRETAEPKASTPASPILTQFQKLKDLKDTAPLHQTEDPNQSSSSNHKNK